MTIHNHRTVLQVAQAEETHRLANELRWRRVYQVIFVIGLALAVVVMK